MLFATVLIKDQVLVVDLALDLVLVANMIYIWVTSVIKILVAMLIFRTVTTITTSINVTSNLTQCFVEQTMAIISEWLNMRSID